MSSWLLFSRSYFDPIIPRPDMSQESLHKSSSLSCNGNVLAISKYFQALLLLHFAMQFDGTKWCAKKCNNPRNAISNREISNQIMNRTGWTFAWRANYVLNWNHALNQLIAGVYSTWINLFELFLPVYTHTALIALIYKTHVLILVRVSN